jgi:hypothetical protein
MVKEGSEMAVGYREGVHHAHLRRSTIEGRQPTGGRSFGSTGGRLADLTKAHEALLFP